MFALALLFSLTCENGLSCCAPTGACVPIASVDECRRGDLGWCQGDECFSPLEPADDTTKKCCPVYEDIVLADACEKPIGMAFFGGQKVFACEVDWIVVRCPAWAEPWPGKFSCLGNG